MIKKKIGIIGVTGSVGTSGLQILIYLKQYL